MPAETDADRLENLLPLFPAVFNLLYASLVTSQGGLTLMEQFVLFSSSSSFSFSSFFALTWSFLFRNRDKVALSLVSLCGREEVLFLFLSFSVVLVVISVALFHAHIHPSSLPPPPPICVFLLRLLLLTCSAGNGVDSTGFPLISSSLLVVSLGLCLCVFLLLFLGSLSDVITTARS